MVSTPSVPAPRRHLTITPASVILVCVAALLAIGLTVLYSASSTAKGGPTAYLYKQLIFLAISIGGGWMVARLDLEQLRKFTWIASAVALVGLLLVLIPHIGITVKGSRRWLGFGGVLQRPSHGVRCGRLWGGGRFSQHGHRHSRRPFHLGGKLVAAASNRDDQAWMFGVRLDLAPQAGDLHVDAAVEAVGVAPGQHLQQPLTRQHPAGALRQGQQQRELARRQRDIGARRIGQTVPGDVEAVAGEVQHRGCLLRRGRRLQRLGHPREQTGLLGCVAHQDDAGGCGAQFGDGVARIPLQPSRRHHRER